MINLLGLSCSAPFRWGMYPPSSAQAQLFLTLSCTQPVSPISSPGWPLECINELVSLQF